MGLAALVWRTHVAETSPRIAAAARAPATQAQWRERLTWMLLAAAPASLLNGVTAHLTADVASAPFLWVIPLELYLATFVIAFSGRAAGPPPWLLAAQLGATPLALMLVFEPNSSLTAQMVVHLWGFFVTALVCHATLAARRPEPGRLTEFYLWMSLGGVLGGSFNAFLAPVLFPQVWEYPAVLVLACLARPASPKRMDDRQRAWLIAGLLWTTPLFIPGLQLADIVRQALMLAPVVIAIMLRDRRTAVVLLYAALALGGEIQGVGRYREHHRSFFGVAHITEIDSHGMGPARVMVHGTTLHGVQALSPAMRCRATSYYVPATVIGQVFKVEQAAKARMRMGVVGLGTGTVATFVRPGDSMRFFEIDPLMKRLALDTRLFTFLDGCAKGPVDVVIGDARLSLAKEPPGSYDLLMLDAFSSDSVPTHLLTVEAMQEYLKLLKPGGVLLLHLSNRNLELTGPTAAAARAAGATVLKGEHWVDPSISHYVEASEIVLLASLDPHALDPFRDNPEWNFKPRPARAWTDDYTNLWGAMIARFQGQP